MTKSETKFTPGPWTLAKDAYPYSPPARVIALPDGTVLAEAFGNDGDWPEGEPEVTANARLITAAPELYEAANAAFDFLGGIDGAANVRGQLLAAIAKARGNHD